MAGSGGVARRVRAAVGLVARAAPGALAGYLLLTAAAGGLPVASSWLTRLIIDGLVSRAAAGPVLAAAAALAATGLVIGITPQLTRYVQAEIERRVGVLTQDQLFAATAAFVGLRRFEDPHFLDRLRLAQQSGGAAPSRLVDGMLGAGRAVLTITGFLGSLLVLSPPMTALVLAAGLPTLVAQLALSRRRAAMLLDVGPVQRREFFYSQLLSTVEAAKEVRLFGIGDHLRRRMLGQRRAANVAARAVDRREVTVQALLGLLAAVTAGAGLVWAVAGARHGGLSVGDVTVFVAAVAGTQSALATLAGEVARSHQALLMFDHYLAVTTARPDLPVAAAPVPLPPLRRGIELRDVWFRYSDEHPWVLRGVNLRIPNGQALALVGLNGAGKSTLVKLLCRFYDPTRGAILWDGVDLRRVAATDLRRRVSAVFQDYMHYEMTAAENIALGDIDAAPDPARLRAAADRAGVGDTLAALPDGYDTLLSRMFFTESDRTEQRSGVSLSGGQWQRLALARALLRDRCDLMILDEPSAGLDAEAEHGIHASLRRHRTGRTSVLISHRLSSVRTADHIVVLRDGRVVERGDHPALVAAGGEYARLFRLQAAGYQADPLPGPPLAVEL